MKPFILILAFGLFMGIAQAQIFTLKGNVTDSTNKQILTETTVLIVSTTTASSRTIITDQQGNFTIDSLAEGEYVLNISHAGFASIKRTIRVKENAFLPIILQKTHANLANVTVLSERKLITQAADRITYNVSESAVSASDNLYNIILKVPGVVESNGTLFYQGKPVHILLDGKSNNLSAADQKDYLSGILGTNSDKLEILLNPSSRYDAQGGIVMNVKSRKNRNYGLTKSFTVGFGHGTYARSPLGFSLNFRDSTINIYGGYDLHYTKQYFHLNALLSFNNDPAQVDLSDHNIRTQANHTIRIGIDYDLDKKTTVGTLFRLSGNSRKRKISDLSLYQPGTSAPDTVVAVDIITDAFFIIPSVNLYVRRKLSAKGAELTVNADYWGMSKQWSDDIAGFYSDKDGNPISSYYLNNNSPADNSVKSGTADYFLPLKNGNMEAGIKLADSKTDNDVLWERLLNNTWKTDSAKTNHFIYRENVYAGYISLLRNYGKWSIQAGMRAELTRSVGNSLTIGLVTNRSYDDLFPSVTVQYKASTKHLLSVTYKKSIRRFGFDIINPFINLQGQYSYHKGNPYIRPSYFNSIGISWTYKNGLVVNGNFSRVTDPISYAYEQGPGNTSHGTNLNFASGKIFSGSANYTAKFFKGKWTSINSGSFTHSEMPDFVSNMQYANSYAFSSVNTIVLPPKWMWEISGFYNSSLLDGTVWQSEYYGVSAGLSKQVLKSKGSLKLSCTDIFNTQILHFKTKGRGINITSDWKVESRFVNLLFIYRFGNLQVKQARNRKTGIEDERARMGIN